MIAAPLKPLTLFFIDRVAQLPPRTTASSGSGSRRPTRPSRRTRSSGSLDDARRRRRPRRVLRDDAKGGSRRTRSSDSDTKDAESAFERIMRNKEKLLSFDEPLRFIFSHSALVEGWDNPNVFTICNLQDGRSEMRKRQQIGRGLRLPVMSNGERCLRRRRQPADGDRARGVLEVRRRPAEGDRGRDRRELRGPHLDLKKDKIKLRLKEEVLDDPIFQELWERISRRTTYELQIRDRRCRRRGGTGASTRWSRSRR